MPASSPDPRAQLPLSKGEPIAPSVRIVLGHLLKLAPEERDGARSERRLATTTPLDRARGNCTPHAGATLLVSMGDERIAAELLLDVQVGGVRYVLLCAIPTSGDETSLSPREREIVRLVARGLPNKTIAETLEISPWTVNTYLRRVFAKLGVTSRAEMVATSISAGLLLMGPPAT